MQRFLVFILIVIFSCIVLVKIFMSGLEPVDYTASLDPSSLMITKPVFDNNQVMLEINWSKIQLVYLCKIIVLLVLVFVAVYNYKLFIGEQEESN